MSHSWIQPNVELSHHVRDRAAAAHARDSLAFGRSSHSKGSLSICSGRLGALRRASSDARLRPVPMQKGEGLEETGGAEKARSGQLATAAWKFKLFAYSFLVEEESLVQFAAEGGGGNDDGPCRRDVLVVRNPERGSRTYEMVLRQERTTPSPENVHL